MTWTQLLAQGRIDRHATSRQELADLRALVARNLQDAAIPGLSPDNQLGLAYEAALILSKMALACAGYRAKGHAHHRTTLEALTLALGTDAQDTADFFEQARRSRNFISYDAAGVVSPGQAAETLREATALVRTVEGWIAVNHPELKK